MRLRRSTISRNGKPPACGEITPDALRSPPAIRTTPPVDAAGIAPPPPGCRPGNRSSYTEATAARACSRSIRHPARSERNAPANPHPQPWVSHFRDAAALARGVAASRLLQNRRGRAERELETRRSDASPPALSWTEFTR
jgi:hypothetical protein